MAVFRVNKNKNYTVMCNEHLQDRRLSLKAKGLLSIMLSLPESWDYSIGGLVSICKEGRSAVEGALGELKECGYLVVVKMYPGQTESGRIEYEYNVFESPQGDCCEREEKQGVENLPIENTPLYKYTNEEKTYYKEKNNILLGKQKKSRFAPPTVDEVRAYCAERRNNIDAEQFVDYYAARGWFAGKQKMKDWKAAVRTWERNSRQDVFGASAPQSVDADMQAKIDYLDSIKMVIK